MGKLKNILSDADVNQFLRICLLLLLFGFIIFRILDYTGFFIDEINCGAETIVTKDQKECYEANGYRFDNADGRSTEKAFEGNYSVKLSPQNQYGMEIKLPIPKRKEEYEASVWFYEQKVSADTSGWAFLVAAIGNNVFWKGQIEVSERKNGWGKLNLKFTIPDGIYTDPLVIYCWNNTKNDVYFDNMSIKLKNYCKIFK